jgi:hypothetical protein
VVPGVRRPHLLHDQVADRLPAAVELFQIGLRPADPALVAVEDRHRHPEGRAELVAGHLAARRVQ